MLERSNTSEAMSPPPLPNSLNVQVQKLPLKCVESIDSLIEALQELAGKRDGFKIEKDIFARIARKQEAAASQDLALQPQILQGIRRDTSVNAVPSAAETD